MDSLLARVRRASFEAEIRADKLASWVTVLKNGGVEVAEDVTIRELLKRRQPPVIGARWLDAA